MKEQLVSLWAARASLPDIINKLERPTQKQQAQKILGLLQYSWQAAFYFCNDRHDGPQPHRELHKTALQVQEYAAKHKCNLEDAWTQLDPNPN